MFHRHALTLEDLAKVERLRVPLPEVKWRRATPEEAACAPTGDLDDVFRERDSLKAEVERLTKERDEAVAKMGRYRNDVERLRAILQEDDQRAWVAMGRPENTRTTNAVLIAEEHEKLRAEVERLTKELGTANEQLAAAYDAPLEGFLELQERHNRLQVEAAKLRAEVERLRELLRRCTRVMCGYRDVEEIGKSPLLDAMAELEKKEAADGQ